MKKILFAVFIAIVGMALMSCGGQWGGRSSFSQNQIAKEATMQTANTAVPVPQITNFLERQNIARRAETMDQPEKLFYVYLFNYGVKEPFAYIVLKGKVSSLRSYLVPQERVGGGGDAGYYVVQDADIDGTYGENVAGIFGYTTGGVYFETVMPYMTFDAPIPIFNVPNMTAAYEAAKGVSK